MKTGMAVMFFVAVASICTPQGHATDFLLTSFQCDPLSCAEQTLPTDIGQALVSFNASCSGGAVGSFDGFAKSVIGVNGPCPALYIAKAQVTRSSTTQLDDFGCEFQVDQVNEIAQVLTAFGTPVWTTQGGVACDGATFGPTNNGTKPC